MKLTKTTSHGSVGMKKSRPLQSPFHVGAVYKKTGMFLRVLRACRMAFVVSN
jgi:hypothetical protein